MYIDRAKPGGDNASLDGDAVQRRRRPVAAPCWPVRHAQGNHAPALPPASYRRDRGLVMPRTVPDAATSVGRVETGKRHLFGTRLPRFSSRHRQVVTRLAPHLKREVGEFTRRLERPSAVLRIAGLHRPSERDLPLPRRRHLHRDRRCNAHRRHALDDHGHRTRSRSWTRCIPVNQWRLRSMA